MIRVHVFGSTRRTRPGPSRAEKLELTDAQWRQQLSAPEQFQILRSGSATERPGCGLLLDNKTGRRLMRAPAAGCRCSRPTRNSIPAPAGRVSSSRSPKETWPSGPTAATAQCGTEINCARCDWPSGGTCSTTARGRLGCVSA